MELLRPPSPPPHPPSAAEETRKIFRDFDPDFEVNPSSVDPCTFPASFGNGGAAVADTQAGSLDEAYLDVSALSAARGGAPGSQLAEELREAVRSATGLTCSVGVAANKRLAKVTGREGLSRNETHLLSLSLLAFAPIMCSGSSPRLFPNPKPPALPSKAPCPSGAHTLYVATEDCFSFILADPMALGSA